MSPIIDVQYRLRELGRIRMGRKGTKGAPQKLKTWRLTSASEVLLQVASERYGGQVKKWDDAPTDGGQFELITESDTLDIVIPPGDAAFSQWMETWSGGGCQKRCDGQRQILRDVPCSCPSDVSERVELAKQGKACKPTTRFNVLLPDIPDVGVWRLETHGWNAALELGAFQNLADVATNQGRMIRARLRIDHRTTKKITNGKAETFKFTVPVVEISHSVGDMLQALGATVDDVAFSLPAPVEGRNLPETRPALPTAAAAWEIKDEQSVEGGDAPTGTGVVSPPSASDGGAPVKGDEPAPATLTEDEERDEKDRLVSLIEQGIELPSVGLAGVIRAAATICTQPGVDAKPPVKAGDIKNLPLIVLQQIATKLSLEEKIGQLV